MDISTGLTIIGSSLVSAKTIEKILGPTADYIGEGIKNFAKKRIENISRVFKNAEDKLGEKIHNDGSVPPKVLKIILDDGSFCDDDLGVQYFGGVLASSRTRIKKDDRAIVFLTMINRLSTYQIRLHYILYTVLYNLCKNNDINMGIVKEAHKNRIYVPESTINEAMDFTIDEKKKSLLLIVHAFHGLLREDLLDLYKCGFGDSKFLRENYVHESEYTLINEPGLIFTPSLFGVELYMWAHGFSDFHVGEFLYNKYVFKSIEGIKIPKGSTKLEKNID